MPINDLLVMELDREVPATRKALERVPVTPDFAPHPKSMSLGKLAPHLAQLPLLGLAVVTQPALDFADWKHAPVTLESGAQLALVFDGSIAQLRAAVVAMPESAWSEPWKLTAGGKVMFEGPRFIAYRQLFLNHMVHHRAQLGTYLRQSGVPVPSTYGPSADEQRPG